MTTPAQRKEYCNSQLEISPILPEMAFLNLKENRRDYHLELQSIMKQPFLCEEAESLQERVGVLQDSIEDAALESKCNLFLRALDLAPDSPPKRQVKTSIYEDLAVYPPKFAEPLARRRNILLSEEFLHTEAKACEERARTSQDSTEDLFDGIQDANPSLVDLPDSVEALVLEWKQENPLGEVFEDRWPLSYYEALNLEVPSHLTKSSVDPYSMLFDEAHEEVIGDAFDYINSPLEALLCNPRLLKKDMQVSLPPETEAFFLHELQGLSFGKTSDIEEQGGQSFIQFLTRRGNLFVLKSARQNVSDEGAKLDQAALAREACIYMALHVAKLPRITELKAYSAQRGLCLEACDGNLATLLENKEMTPQNIAQLFTHIAEGVAALHKLGMCYQDLKLTNIFFIEKPGGEVLIKIGDFGGLNLTNVRQSYFVGTYEFGSPSKLKKLSTESRAEYPVLPSEDCWTLGLLYLEALSGCWCPFYDKRKIQGVEREWRAFRDGKKATHSHDVAEVINEYRQSYGDAITKEIKDGLIKRICIIRSVVDRLSKPCTREDLLANLSESAERLQERDPEGALLEIVMGLLHGDDEQRLDMEGVLTKLKNLPQAYR